MMRHCPQCNQDTEHIEGRSFWLGDAHVNMGDAGPHCTKCVTRLASTAMQAKPPDAPGPAPEDRVMPFGKHKGKTLGQIAERDLLYVDWLAGIGLRDHRLQQAVWHICAGRNHEIQRLIEERDGSA